MTVGELITHLKKFDKELPVGRFGHFGEFYEMDHYDFYECGAWEDGPCYLAIVPPDIGPDPD